MGSNVKFSYPVAITANESAVWQNMRVRVIGGKTFCSRMGRMVAGEMKVNFLLLDLKTVVHGSYR